MTNSETKNFSQNVSSSYHLGGKSSNECKKDSLNIPKLRFKGYNEEWKHYRLKDIVQIYDGTHQTPNYIDDGIKFVSVENINNLDKTNKYISREDYEKDFKIKPEINDILMTRIGDIGTPAIINTNERYAYYVSLALLKSNYAILSPKFLIQRISSEQFQHELWKRTLHVAFPKKINKNEIGECNVFIPSLPEQEKIASFLTLIDKKIEKQKELVELLKKYKRGLLSQIFSQKLRFKDENGNNYPDWEEKRLGDICTTFSGGTPSITHQEYYNGDIPFIKSGEIHSDKTEMFITDIGLKNSSAKLVKKGDLLFALYGATSGEVDISKINGAINQAILCVKSDTLNLNYLKELLSYNKNQILCKYLQGGQGNLSADIFKALKFKFPIKKEQDKISDFLINYDKITHIEEHLLNLYINYKQGLLQQLFI